MLRVKKIINVLAFCSLLSLCVVSNVNAQTPADDPGIGGPGTSGSSPEGDGAPIVPFDNNLNLMFCAVGIVFIADRMKSIKYIVKEL